MLSNFWKIHRKNVIFPKKVKFRPTASSKYILWLNWKRERLHWKWLLSSDITLLYVFWVSSSQKCPNAGDTQRYRAWMQHAETLTFWGKTILQLSMKDRHWNRDMSETTFDSLIAFGMCRSCDLSLDIIWIQEFGHSSLTAHGSFYNSFQNLSILCITNIELESNSFKLCMSDASCSVKTT